MLVEIVTPEGVLYKGQVISVVIPSVKGDFQVLEGHAPVVALMKKGFLKLKQKISPEIFNQEYFQSKSDEYLMMVNGGIAELKNNKIIILVD